MGYQYTKDGNNMFASLQGKTVSVSLNKGNKYTILIPANNIVFDFLMPQDCGFKLHTLGIFGHDNRDYADLVQAAFLKLKYEH